MTILWLVTRHSSIDAGKNFLDGLKNCAKNIAKTFGKYKDLKGREDKLLGTMELESSDKTIILSSISSAVINLQ